MNNRIEEKIPTIRYLTYADFLDLENVEAVTGLRFTIKSPQEYISTPDNYNQIGLLFSSFNLKSYYQDNPQYENTLHVKKVSVVGFLVKEMCFECAQRGGFSFYKGEKKGDYFEC